MITPMKNESNPTHWVVLVCPPQFKRHVSKWVSKSALRSWRHEWSKQMLQSLEPVLTSGGDQLSWRCCHQFLRQEVESLQKEFNTHRVLDARLQRVEGHHPPVNSAQPVGSHDRWSVPGGVAMMGAVLMAAAD
jgi:hypothetical protein